MCCARCGEKPVTYRVQSEVIDLWVCTNCGFEARRIEGRNPGGEGRLAVRPLRLDEIERLTCCSESV